jgi:peptide chain release factor 2
VSPEVSARIVNQVFSSGRPDSWKKNCSTARKPSSSGWSNSETLFDYAGKQSQIRQIEEQMGRPGFWDNQEKAQTVVAELKALNSLVKPLDEAGKAALDIQALVEMAEEDESFAGELPAELARVEALIAELELRGLLNGPHDAKGAILTINARDGGTDANDWAEMLLRMYIHWAQKQDYSVELLDRQDNEEAGINNATLVIRGPMAYGYLKGETGMHRLVRISPFNAEGKRQTSFAAIDVSPEIADTFEVELNDEDIREDVFRASGAGGQHVNKTSSAIRLTHLPTGIVVQCQNERSQHKNRATALKMLRARLARLEEERREAEQAAKYQEKAKTGFGSQIRNYFLHPDQRVKDARTGYYVGSFQSVLDGNIQGFLDAYLRWRVGQEVAN